MTFFWPLSRPLTLSFRSPSKSVPLQPPSACSRVRESCISIFFRWSKRGPCGSRSRMPVAFPFPASPFLSLSLFAPSPLPFFLTESPGAASRHGRTPFLKTHTRTVPDSLRTMARIPVFLLPPCSLIFSLSLPSLLLPSSPSRYVARSPRRLFPPSFSLVPPTLYCFFNPPPLRRYFTFQ